MFSYVPIIENHHWREQLGMAPYDSSSSFSVPRRPPAAEAVNSSTAGDATAWLPVRVTVDAVFEQAARTGTGLHGAV